MKRWKCFIFVGAMLTGVQGHAQGYVVFANDAQSLVINTATGLPVVTGLVRVGLYYNADLAAVPIRDAPDDSFDQAGAFVAVGGIFGPGRFAGGNRYIPQVDPASGMALIQVRAWSADYNSYEEAFSAGLAGARDVCIGFSDVLLMTPASGISPPPTLANHGGLRSFPVYVCAVPEPSMIFLLVGGGLVILLSCGRSC